MKKYEIMYILNADLEETARKEEMEKLHAILTSAGGEILDVNEWGVKDLAYPINDLLKGYYVVIKVNSEQAGLLEFSRLVRINNNVLRHLVIVDQE